MIQVVNKVAAISLVLISAASPVLCNAGHKGRRETGGPSLGCLALVGSAIAVTGAVVGGLIGGAIGQDMARKEPITQKKNLKNEKIAREMQAKDNQQKALRVMDRTRLTYRAELHWLGANPIRFFEDRVARMIGVARDAHLIYQEKLKLAIEELKVNLPYLYGPEHAEAQETLHQLQELYELYMEFFGEQIQHEKNIRHRLEDEKYERDQARRLKEAKIERQQEEARLAARQRKSIDSLEREIRDLNNQVYSLRAGQVIDQCLSGRPPYALLF